ncbi:MAG: hypothetical protein ABH824_03645 [Nanoarchaeota archaeon]
MKVLLLDRNMSDSLREQYQKALEERGHDVVSAQIMSTLSDYVKDPEGFLAQLNMAFVHPHWMDVEALETELRKRPDFRVVFYKVDGLDEYEGRCVYREYLSKENLVSLVENGSQ